MGKTLEKERVAIADLLNILLKRGKKGHNAAVSHFVNWAWEEGVISNVESALLPETWQELGTSLWDVIANGGKEGKIVSGLVETCKLTESTFKEMKAEWAAAVSAVTAISLPGVDYGKAETLSVRAPVAISKLFGTQLMAIGRGATIPIRNPVTRELVEIEGGANGNAMPQNEESVKSQQESHQWRNDCRESTSSKTPAIPLEPLPLNKSSDFSNLEANAQKISPVHPLAAASFSLCIRNCGGWDPGGDREGKQAGST